MKFEERLSNYIGEVVDEICVKSERCDEVSLQAKEREIILVDKLIDCLDDEAGQLFEEYRNIIHTKMTKELERVYIEGIRHGIKLFNLLCNDTMQKINKNIGVFLCKT